MNRIVLEKVEEKVLLYLIKNDDIAQIITCEDHDYPKSAIYVGRVNAIKAELEAAFVNLSKDYSGFLPIDEWTHYLKCGEQVVVQVTKNPIKSKPVTLSMKVEIPGKYCVVDSKEYEFNFSTKLNKEERQKIRDELQNLITEFEYGGIIRTNAKFASFSEIYDELKKNHTLLKDIMDYGNSRSLYSCLYEPDASFINQIDEINEGDYDEIVTDDTELFEKLREKYDKKARLHDTKEISLSSLYRLNHFNELATNRKVNLKCGGFIIIDFTEAMCVIDVNSGKIDKKAKKEDMINKVNEEAAAEIARQLILRNISGMILVDFINDKNTDLVHLMNEKLKNDPLKAKAVDVTKLGIVEITRKRS